MRVFSSFRSSPSPRRVLSISWNHEEDITCGEIDHAGSGERSAYRLVQQPGHEIGMAVKTMGAIWGATHVERQCLILTWQGCPTSGQSSLQNNARSNANNGHESPGLFLRAWRR